MFKREPKAERSRLENGNKPRKMNAHLKLVLSSRQQKPKFYCYI